MSKEQDSATNKSLRVGISGENALPTLDHFSVVVKRGEHTEILEAPSYWVSSQSFNNAVWTKLKNKQ